ncbi:MAG: bi-domain-containing oxidoreductase [Puniceicoccales bacterium]|jgi:predicted dehydrogenase/threonine dehydrogenase-like Zn-dependent dehydrogenase|nr:bi-domain-containing oxidoreductase [Puniceicoccales bacterium]
MRQILQNLGSGETLLADVAAPGVRAGCLLIETEASLVSLGTERALVDFGRASFLGKLRKQPEKVKQVLQKIKTDGLFPTLDAVRAKLEEPLALGYCNVGRVVAVGAGVEKFAVGDRVASNGPHAEVVCVPKNLCAKVPPAVNAEAAAFTVLGAVALQGVRLLKPALGENIAVIGLGLVGLLAAQLLRAAGCRVLGVDFDARKCDLARQLGAETVNPAAGGDALCATLEWTGGRGADGVIVAASSAGSEPMLEAARLCRKRGRIVQVGVTGLELKRPELYEKELSVQVSCSYGPGRYDDAYEQRGDDYPYAYVRWTEQRNFEAVLGLLAEKKLDTAPLISHRFAFADALDAYQVVATGGALGIVLNYIAGTAAAGGGADVAADPLAKFARTVPANAAGDGANGANTVAAGTGVKIVAGFLGAGLFTGRTLLPALRSLRGSAPPVVLKTIVSAGGVSGAFLARKHGFAQSSTDPETVLGDPDVNTVFITTRHAAHAAQVLRALAAGKHVFVEKPLCLTLGELDAIRAAATGAGAPKLFLGFNRRFSPHTLALKRELAGASGAKSFILTANAGAIPANHWLQDPATGGGRIVGEACHYIDLLRFLAGAAITGAEIRFMGGEGGKLGDTASILLTFADGSIGTVHYFANGDKSFPKERVEAFFDGKIVVIDNFRKTTGYGTRKRVLCSGWRQDKGHAAELAAFLGTVATGAPPPIPLDEILEVSRTAITLARRAP